MAMRVAAHVDNDSATVPPDLSVTPRFLKQLLLASQLRDRGGAESRSRSAEARRDVVGDARDLLVGIGGAKGRHIVGVTARVPWAARDDDLRNVDSARIVDRAGPRERCERKHRTLSGPDRKSTRLN